MKRVYAMWAVAVALGACGGKTNSSTATTTDSLTPTAMNDAPKPTPVETVFVAQVPPPAPRRPVPPPPPPPGSASMPAPIPAPRPAPRGRGFLDAGTEIKTTLVDGIHSQVNGPGEPIRATVSNDVIDNGRVVIPAGSTVTFRINAIGPATSAGERATLDLGAESVAINGRAYPIRGTAHDYDFELKGRSVNAGDVATAAGGAAIGAIIGHVLGGKTGTIVGAVGGGAAGTAVAAKHVDRDIIVHPGASVTLLLLEPFER